MARVFFDTNVLVYTADNRDERKQRIARNLVKGALNGRLDGWISVQTLSEFINSTLNKLKLPLDKVDGFLDFFDNLPIVNPDRALPRRGLEIKNRYDIQFYDAMMIAAAERAGANDFYTEDLNDGQLYGSVRAVNPFKDIDVPQP